MMIIIVLLEDRLEKGLELPEDEDEKKKKRLKEATVLKLNSKISA